MRRITSNSKSFVAQYPLALPQATNHELIERCFYQWLENSRAQMTQMAQRVEGFTQRQGDATLLKAFSTWRRHMHSTLIARAYEKSLRERVVATMFCEWRTVTSTLLQSAVHSFSEKIGLLDHVTEVNGAESGVGTTEDSEMDLEEAINRSCASYSSSFSIGSSARRIFGETSMSFDTDTDRMVLLSGGLQASAHDHQLKCQRLKGVYGMAQLGTAETRLGIQEPTTL
ncbi:hypothetical protein PoB_003231100 [Plakobranchus ocellatus]|uniref:Uncharacterized protein n=1 Tax=Plakobranchus ocellatus TaxID=259542 RepID=A0AAV4AGQ3_9GAST|nr:hypothetical protein PoB_003231100 [Plakobranchus ocellatus]